MLNIPYFKFYKFNKCAGALANSACHMEEDLVMFQQVPSFLGQLLFFDSVGAVSPCVVPMLFLFLGLLAPLNTKKSNSTSSVDVKFIFTVSNT